MEKFHIADVPKTDRITHLVDNLYAKMPVIESARAKLITESYKATEDEPIITRRAKAFAHILHNIPIIIRDEELIVGSSTLAPRGCQTFPEYSFQWLEDELDTVATRTADPFYIAEETKAELREVHKYWKGKTTSELATSYMAPEAILAIDHNIFTPGNYFYNGVGHVTVKYEEVLAIGYEGIIAKAQKELDECNVGDGDYAKKSRFLEAVIMSCQAVIDYAHRYAELAEQMAYQCQDPTRKQELLQIASNCTRVPAKGARNFYEACQSFWFVQQLIQMESSGHSISPGRFDQYMYPYYKSDMEAGNLTRLDDGQQLLLTDTVGFIRKLPHNLVEAFKSTLEEAKYADYIIHVVDASNPQAEIQMHIVYETLKELGALGKKTITLFNKQDRVSGESFRDLRADHTLKISARTGEGLEEFKQLLSEILAEGQIYMERLFPYSEAGQIQLIREYGQLLSEEYTEGGIAVKARVPREIYPKVT